MCREEWLVEFQGHTFTSKAVNQVLLFLCLFHSKLCLTTHSFIHSIIAMLYRIIIDVKKRVIGHINCARN